jgi:hypothetical protein
MRINVGPELFRHPDGFLDFWGFGANLNIPWLLAQLSPDH